MADDGVGPAVVGRMIRRGLPAALRATTIEGDLLGLASVWRGEREVWLVDAVTGSGPPGTLHDLGHREVLDVPGGGFTAHHPNVGDCLRWLMHAWPDLGSVRYRLFGVEVEVVRPGDRLSAVVEKAVERLVDRLLEAAREEVGVGDSAPLIWGPDSIATSVE